MSPLIPRQRWLRRPSKHLSEGALATGALAATSRSSLRSIVALFVHRALGAKPMKAQRGHAGCG
eukprot:2198647-Pyramimonas_sp.AAC.1